MAAAFDFEKYYTIEKVRTDTSIDRSGVELQNPTETSEIVTNNVVYYVAGIECTLASGEKGTIWGTIGNPQANCRIAITDKKENEAGRADDGDSSAGIYYIRPWQPLGDIASLGLDTNWLNPGADRMSCIKISAADNEDFQFELIDDWQHKYIGLTEFTAWVFPRIEAMDSDPVSGSGVSLTDVLDNFGKRKDGTEYAKQGPVSDYKLMKLMYGALGFYGGRWKSMKWLDWCRKNTKRYGSPVMGLDTFNKKIANLTEVCAESNVGVNVVYYDTSFSKDVEAEDATREDYLKNRSKAKEQHRKYVQAVNDADITRTKMGKTVSFKDAYEKHLPEFIQKMKDEGKPLPELTGLSANAVIPPLKEAVKAYFYPIDEIESEFENMFASTMNAISKVPYMWKYVDSAKKAELKEVERKCKEDPEAVDEIDPAKNNRLVFDLDILANYGAATYIDGIEFSDQYMNLFWMYPRVIQVGFIPETDGSYIFGRPWYTEDYRQNMEFRGWDVARTRGEPYYASDNDVYWRYDDTDANRGTYEVNGRNLKRYSRISADELDSILVDMYNTMILPRLGSVAASTGAMKKENVAAIKKDPLNTKGDTIGYFRKFYQSITSLMNAMRLLSAGDSMYATAESESDTAGMQLGQLYESLARPNIYNKTGRHTGGLQHFTVTVNAVGAGSRPQDSVDELNIVLGYPTVTVMDSTDTPREYSDPTQGILRYSHGYYDIINWGDCSVVGDPIDDAKLFTADYGHDWTDLSSNKYLSVGYAIQAVMVMQSIYKQMCRELTSNLLEIGPVGAIRAYSALDDVEEDLERLYELANQMRWYQTFVQDAPFSNMSCIPDDNYTAYPNTWTNPARLMFPVLMYKKVRVKYKNILGLTRHKRVKRSIGVRWAEVTFYDMNVYAAYPQVTEEPGEVFVLDTRVTISTEGDTTTIVPDYPLSSDIVSRGKGKLTVGAKDGSNVPIAVTIKGDMLMTSDGAVDQGLVGEFPALELRVPPAKSQKEIGREPVDIIFRTPGLPYDSELRKTVFQDYGPFSHAVFFDADRNDSSGILPGETIDDYFARVDSSHHDGWTVFHRTSSDIKDLRDGLGVHDKVAMLVSMLKKEFGDSRVKLVETYRSLDDQIPQCTGGPESYFLSWHNYGLAAKILIVKDDGRTPIEKDGPEMKRMIPIARAFTECCLMGRFGTPCNVVWCARLAVGPSVFDWEFLPIGVGHKDAYRFREAVLSQRDPLKELGYVPVDSEGLVVDVAPDDDRPYVLSTSASYINALKVYGRKYMPPDQIMNYSTPRDIVLQDVKEYVNLIRLKMNAHGTSKPESGNIYDWKNLNPDAPGQLVTFYTIMGNIQSAKAVLAGDYVERYGSIDYQYYGTDSIAYLREMLGDLYYDIRITMPRDGESSFISLHDGKFRMRSREAYPQNPPTRLDLHKQQQVDTRHIAWGSWKDGIFYTEDELPVEVYESDVPVIDGYEPSFDEDTGEQVWNPVSGEARFLHTLVAERVHRRFVEIRDMFEGFGGQLAYDRIDESPNADMLDMLENEFGLIKAQDLVDFDDLERMFSVDPSIEMVDGSIYEKVVNNAQLAGIRKASLTKEHIHIKDLPSRRDAKTLYDLMQKGKGYMANDLLK